LAILLIFRLISKELSKKALITSVIIVAGYIVAVLTVAFSALIVTSFV
jgi:hypothetical protein